MKLTNQRRKVSTIIFLTLLASTGLASEIEQITLAQLESQAQYIVLGKVISLQEEGTRDQVTIQVDSYLKGQSPQTMFTFPLVTRGGLKDFDPSLQPGDTGVFFLNPGGEEGRAEKAYWGSIAIFPKPNFVSAGKSSPQPAATPGQGIPALKLWRSYRSKRGEIVESEDYNQGFRQGYRNPPGLVDGGHDFNLGHSDGMLARMGRLPDQPDAEGAQ